MLRYVLDPNLLVYGFDPSAPEKQRRALTVLALLGRRPIAALLTQVLAQLASVGLRKLDPPLVPDDV